MSGRATEDVIEALAAEATPVRPLAPPLARAGRLLLVLGLLSAVTIAVLGDLDGMMARYSGRETMMMAETGAMLATAILAFCGAFALSVPGGSRAWLAAPLPTFLLWIGLSGAGCYDLMLRRGLGGWGTVGDGTCFFFLMAASVGVGVPVLWLLSRARPIEPLAVATLGGLGVAATAAVLLQFFHPFAVTVIDLVFHLLAVLIVVTAAALLRRLALRPG